MKWLAILFDFLRRLFGFGRSPGPVREDQSPPVWTRPRVELAEWTGSGSLPPMMWKQCHPRTRATFKAEMTCSNGHAVSLRGHSISADGVVWPSVVCLSPGCDFHDFVSLGGWSNGAL